MNKTLFKRRQLLWFGAGIVGAGAIAAISRRDSGAKGSDPIPNANSPSVMNSPQVSEPIAAAPSGMTLPEFQGISQWLNSDPLTTSSLKGNVVLIQFWTFACINCQRTLPYVTRWHRDYGDRGLKVIGIHTPEFPFERDINNIKNALNQHQITYPVPVDQEFKTWKAYQNEYWPHLFLADRQGIIRYDHIGEGAYDTTEQKIRQLLG